jgi:aminopeptidase
MLGVRQKLSYNAHIKKLIGYPMLIIPRILGSEIQSRIAFLEEFKTQHPAWEALVSAVLDEVGQPVAVTDAIQILHRVQRCYYAARLGLLEHKDVRDAIDDPRFPLWKNYHALPATEDQKDNLARLMFEGDVQRRAPVLIGLCDYSRDIAERIIARCINEKTDTDIMISDPVFQRRLLTHCTSQQADQFGRLVMQPHQQCTRRITLRTEQVDMVYVDPPISQDIQKHYNVAVSDEHQRSRDKFYTLTVLPTPKDAELDSIPYPDYIDLFFRMCAVDWTKVDAAHRVLIEQLNTASQVRITNDDGTDVRMSIDGFTFCNSLVAKNVPGSEVFSGVVRDSVNGVMVGKGRYMYNGKIMENITLRFEQGRVVSYEAEQGGDVLKDMIETDEGSHYVGELGIGTNPVLRQHLVNGLMVEKIGGFTDYLGTPVIVDNGNNSAIHEDLTVMLYGKNGKIYLDDQLIMDKGAFLDPRLAYLNGDH